MGYDWFSVRFSVRFSSASEKTTDFRGLSEKTTDYDLEETQTLSAVRNTPKTENNVNS